MPKPYSPTSPLLAFIVGVSLPAFAVTFAYLGHAYRQTPYQSKIPFELLPFVVPLLFGFANIVSVKLMPRLGYPLAPLIVGAATGLLLSIIGRFGFDLPRLLFRMPAGTHHRVHLIAPIMYALIFTAIIAPLTAVVAASA
jgi:hypothetical protein